MDIQELNQIDVLIKRNNKNRMKKQSFIIIDRADLIKIRENYDITQFKKIHSILNGKYEYQANYNYYSIIKRKYGLYCEKEFVAVKKGVDKTAFLALAPALILVKSFLKIISYNGK